MKRVFALALAICMALSMMVLTASAAASCTKHGVVFYCKEHPGMEHWCVQDNFFGFRFYSCYFNETGEFAEHRDLYDKEFASGVTPEVGKMYVADHGYLVLCSNTPPAPAQPKTGVMDTLPIWFGVMAVSACAYVLTSKKKVF